jgi:hypothetical protein
MTARQCFPELLERPFPCGMGSDVLVENLVGSDLHHDQGPGLPVGACITNTAS